MGAEDPGVAPIHPSRAKATCTELTPGTTSQPGPAEASDDVSAPGCNRPGSPLTRTATTLWPARVACCDDLLDGRGNVGAQRRFALGRRGRGKQGAAIAGCRPATSAPATASARHRSDIRPSPARSRRSTICAEPSFAMALKSPAAPRRCPGHVDHRAPRRESRFPRGGRKFADGTRLSPVRSASASARRYLLGRRARRKRRLRPSCSPRRVAQDVSGASWATIFRGRAGMVMGVPLARGQLGQLAGMAEQQDRLERGNRRGDPARSPSRCPPRSLLVAEREMPCGGLGADVAGHEHRGRHAAGRGHVERALQRVAQRLARNTAARCPWCPGSTVRLRSPAAD